MKKLLGTTALVAAAFATAPAMAADKIQAKVGGYFVHQIAAVIDIDQVLAAGQDDRTFAFGQEGEIHFKGSTTLDNGIEVGVKAELELNGAGNIDEAYMYLSGAFGEFQLGDQDGVGDQMPVVAPSPFLETFANDTDLDPLAPLGVTPNTVLDHSGDDSKIIYFTPRLAGFQLGLSYAPENAQIGWNSAQTNLVKDNNTDENQFEVGLTFEHSFNAIDLAASVVYLTVENVLANAGSGGIGGAATTDDASDIAIGASVGFAGFTVGGSWSEKETDGVANFAGTRVLNEATDWGIGATYGTGPWTFGLEYAETERDALTAAQTGGLAVAQIDNKAWVGGASYSLGGGVNVGLGYTYKESGNTGPGGTDQEGSAVFTELGVKF